MVAPVNRYLSAWMKTTNLGLVFAKVWQLIGDLTCFVTGLEEELLLDVILCCF